MDWPESNPGFGREFLLVALCSLVCLCESFSPSPSILFSISKYSTGQK